MLAALRRPELAVSGLLAVGVHGLLFGLLIAGVSWKRTPPPKLIVELWQELPQVTASRAPASVHTPPEPQPRPAPAPVPVEAPKPVPKPPAAEKPPAPKPVEPPPEPKPPAPPPQPAKASTAPNAIPRADNAPAPEVAQAETRIQEKKLRDERDLEERLKREERKRLEQIVREEDARKRAADAERQREDDARRRAEEAARKEEDAQREAELKKVREAMQRQTRIAEEQRAAAERIEAEKYAATQAAIKAQQLIDEYKVRIQLAIRDKVKLPPGVDSRIEAVFDVRLLKAGSVASMRLVKPSGSPAYDKAVEQAIEKAQPLPVPEDLDLFQQIRDLTLVFRPNE